MVLKLNPDTGLLDLTGVDTSGIITLDGDTGSATGDPVTIAGGTGITTSAGGDTLTVDLDTPVVVSNGGTGRSTLAPVNGVLVANSTLNVGTTNSSTNGQLLIGRSLGAPSFSTVTSTAGTIVFTTGPNALNMEAVSGPVTNIGISYSSSTLTIHGADGTALSASNPGFIILGSKTTPGEKVLYTVTANQSFIDESGASEITNNLFGLTTGVGLATPVPFYIYAVGNDDEDEIAFMISRVPQRKTAPAVGSIGAPDDAVADTQGSFWSLENIDETLYDGNPCASIGSFRMECSTLDDWTVQTINQSDGIGEFNESTMFSVLKGQFGAASGKYFEDNGGTAPGFGSVQYMYRINRHGICAVTARFTQVAIPGVGSVDARLALPFLASNDYNNVNVVTGSCRYNNHQGGAQLLYTGATDIQEGTQILRSVIETIRTTWIQHDDFDTTDSYWIENEYLVED